MQVRGRAIMMSYQASNVPKWIAEKLQSAITKNLTLPSCADIPLPYLLPGDHPDAGAALPGFLRALQGGASPSTASMPVEAHFNSLRYSGLRQHSARLRTWSMSA